MSQKLTVSLIVKTLGFREVPGKVQDWNGRITGDWNIQQIIPRHFSAPVNANRATFLAACAFLDDLLDEREVKRPTLTNLLDALTGNAPSYFVKKLSSLDQFLVSVGAVKNTVSAESDDSVQWLL